VKALLAVAVSALAAGVALVVYSAVEGGASVALFLVFPVVSGSSLSFLAGVLLVFVGFVLLPFALAGGWDEAEPLPRSPSPGPPTAKGGGVGGFVLIGPVPIVFGSWKGVSRRTRWLLALAGAFLLTLAIVALVLLAR
jgi:uncharacterized membrane protein